MLAALILLANPLTYAIAPGDTLRYQMDVSFDGFLPVLAGQQVLLDLSVEVEVKGQAPDSEGRPQATSEMKAFVAKLNGHELPFNLDNAVGYFPKTTVSYTGTGKVVKTDAPDLPLPFRLPGLHVKRFPEITYLPIELPESAMEQGKSWTFSRAFGDSTVNYVATASKISEAEVEIDLKLSQTYELLEDEGLMVVTDPAEAVRKVTTKVEGGGKVVFDPKRRIVRSVNLSADAVSDVQDLKTQARSERKLKTIHKVALKEPKP